MYRKRDKKNRLGKPMAARYVAAQRDIRFACDMLRGRNAICLPAVGVNCKLRLCKRDASSGISASECLEMQRQIVCQRDAVHFQSEPEERMIEEIRIVGDRAEYFAVFAVKLDLDQGDESLFSDRRFH